MNYKLSKVCYQNRFKQLDANSIMELACNSRDIALLPSSQNYDLFTSFELGGEYKCSGKVITLGKARYANIKYWNGDFISSNNNIIESKDESILNAKYLYYFLSYTAKDYYVEATTYPKFDQPSFDNHLIDVPSLEEQKRRIDILDSINKIIDTEQRELTLMDAAIKSRFNEMFLTGEARMHFQNKKWDDVVVIHNGKDYKANIADKENGYPVYGSGGFMGVYADRYLCDGSLTIIGRKGTIDKPFFVNGKIWNIDTAFGIEAKKEIIDPVYFYHRSKFYNYLELNKQTTKPSLRKSDLQKLIIEIPPMNLQKNFVLFVEQIDKLKFNVQKRIEFYQELLNKKMDEYFN